MYRSLPLHIRPKSVAVTNGVIVEEDYDAIWHDEKDYAKVCISSTFLKFTWSILWLKSLSINVFDIQKIWKIHDGLNIGLFWKLGYHSALSNLKHCQIRNIKT